jgi:hypothetical protein
LEKPSTKQEKKENQAITEPQKTENQVKENQTIEKQEMQKKKIFGLNLDELVKKEKLKAKEIPKFLQEIIMQILLRGLNVENLFLHSNSIVDKIDSLVAKIDNKQKYDLSNESPFVLSLVIKKFFKSLPEPLIPVQHYSTFLEGNFIFILYFILIF